MILTIRPISQSVSHQWRTSIQTATTAGEKRSALYTWPRVKLSSEYAFQGSTKRAWMRRNLLNLEDLWEIPLWHDETALTAQAASGQKILTVGATNYRHFYPGRECILIGSSFESYETGTIDTVDSATQITLVDNLASTWPIGTLVIPLYSFRVTSPQELQSLDRPRQSTAFEATEAFESSRSFSYTLPTPTLDTYEGYDIIPFNPHTSLVSRYAHPYDLLQSLGLGYPYTHRDVTVISLETFFVEAQGSDAWDLLEFFDSRMGRLNPFWCPTWNKDIVVTSAIGAADVTLIIEDIEWAAFYENNDMIGTYIYIRLPDQSYVCREITSAPTSTSIVIDSAIGTAVGADELDALRISFLLLARFGIDEIRFDYEVDKYISAGASVISIPPVFEASSALLEDDFTGAVLNATKWATNIVPASSVTQNDVLELNNLTGGAHSGAACYSQDAFSLASGTLQLVVKWKPHKDHYAGGAYPYISFHAATSNRNVYYGNPDSRCVHLQLGNAGDTTDRTYLFLYDAGVGAGYTQRDVQAINIDETLWHDIIFSIDCATLAVTVDVDAATYTLGYTISAGVWSALGVSILVEMGTCDYNKNNTEQFDDFILTRE